MLADGLSMQPSQALGLVDGPGATRLDTPSKSAVGKPVIRAQLLPVAMFLIGAVRRICRRLHDAGRAQPPSL